MENEASIQPTLNIAVDPDHGALRVAVLGLFILVGIATYAVANLFLYVDGFNIIAFIIAAVFTYFVVQRLENLLKVRWPSGRSVQIASGQIQINNKGKTAVTIDGDAQANVMMWRFTVNRRARVPKGWLVVACALEQEQTYLPVFTFMSPAQFNALVNAHRFTMLVPKKELEKEDAGRDLRAAGQQRRLLVAEQARWMDGAEMTPNDFVRYVDYLQANFPKWMPLG